jgi:hypothetical protein
MFLVFKLAELSFDVNCWRLFFYLEMIDEMSVVMGLE